MPQFVALELVSTHAPLQLVVVPGHAPVRHVPAEQTSPAAQLRPHMPQFVGLLVVSTHASPQRAKVPVQAQPPLTQLLVPGQTRPHMPQLALSLCVLRHVPLHDTSVPRQPLEASRGATNASLGASTPASAPMAMLSIQVRMQSMLAISSAPVGGMMPPHSGVSDVSFSMRKEFAASPGMTSVRPAHVFEP
jgi:hypothetical protein